MVKWEFWRGYLRSINISLAKIKQEIISIDFNRFWFCVKLIIQSPFALLLFLANVFILYPLKTLENLWFSGVFRGIKWEHWIETGYIFCEISLRKPFSSENCWVRYPVGDSLSNYFKIKYYLRNSSTVSKSKK